MISVSTDPKDRRLVSVKEFATIAGLHEQTVYRQIADGHLQGVVRLGGAIRINTVIALRSRPRPDDDE